MANVYADRVKETSSHAAGTADAGRRCVCSVGSVNYGG